MPRALPTACSHFRQWGPQKQSPRHSHSKGLSCPMSSQCDKHVSCSREKKKISGMLNTLLSHIASFQQHFRKLPNLQTAEQTTQISDDDDDVWATWIITLIYVTLLPESPDFIHHSCKGWDSQHGYPRTTHGSCKRHLALSNSSVEHLCC